VRERAREYAYDDADGGGVGGYLCLGGLCEQERWCACARARARVPAGDCGTSTVLPTAEADEFKPFVRKLPEFKFWHSVTRVILFLACGVAPEGWRRT
jgi:hypothetical protein